MLSQELKEKLATGDADALFEGLNELQRLGFKVPVPIRPGLPLSVEQWDVLITALEALTPDQMDLMAMHDLALKIDDFGKRRRMHAAMANGR